MEEKNLFSVLEEYSSDEQLQETVHYLEEKNVVRFDRKTARKRLFTQAVLLAAKEANDPLYIKYAKVSNKRRELRRQIQIKYSAKGKQKLRDFTERRKVRKAAKEDK